MVRVGTRARIIVTVAFAVAIGAWAYLEQKQVSIYSQATYDALHSAVADILLLGLPITVGILVRRPWVLLALIGPLLSLGYLQATGYRSPWHDGNPPLFSLPGISSFVYLAVLLLLGVLLGRFAERRGRDTCAPGRLRP